jgi:hypothetical protein
MITEREAYAAIKWLTEQPQWKTFEALVQGEVDKLLQVFSTDPGADVKELQIKVLQTMRVQRLAHDLIESVEDDIKENGR